MEKMPYNLEAEKTLLGALFLDNDSMFKIIDLIDPNDFYDKKHSKIYIACLRCLADDKKVDIITVNDILNNEIKIKELVEINNSAITSSRILDHAKIIKDKSLRRKIIEAQNKNNSIVMDENQDINTVISKCQNEIFNVNPFKIKSDDIISIIGVLEDRQKLYSEKYEQGKNLMGYSCGIEKIDNAIDGVQPGHFWTIGSWHGCGKTSFALNIIHELLRQDVPCSIISLEMGQVDLVARTMSIRTGITAQKILKGKNDDSVNNSIIEAKDFLKKSILEIHTEYDLDKIKMTIRKDFFTKGVKVVMVDYLQKIQHEKIFDETPLMARASIQLANLAQELGITIILLSQISNEAKKGGGAGAGYKGSGTIEAVSDLAIVLKRNKKDEDPDWEYAPVDIHITKNKFGFDGYFTYYMHLKTGKFVWTTIDEETQKNIDKF